MADEQKSIGSGVHDLVEYEPFEEIHNRKEQQDSSNERLLSRYLKPNEEYWNKQKQIFAS